MSAYRETSDASEDDKEANPVAGNTQTPIPDQGEESREMNT